MMSEQRYTVGLQSKTIFDMKTELYLFDNKIICELLNAQNSLICEQQATNDYLEESNSRLQVQLGETLRLVDEQQATIKKLQDLCGESDSENAKLRIENKKLKAKLKEKEEDERLYANEIVELRKTNEEWLQFKDLGGDY